MASCAVTVQRPWRRIFTYMHDEATFAMPFSYRSIILSANLPKKTTAVLFSVIFLGCWLLIFVYFISQGFHEEFLNCESGWFLNIAVDNKTAWKFWLHSLATRAYNGHYAPFAFGLELVQAHMFGVGERLWLLRQAGALTLLLLSMVRLVRHLCRGGSSFLWIPAVSTGFIFIAQPAILDLVSWPFMVMQITCISLALLALTELMIYAEDGQIGSALKSLAWAYGSMHLFGVGAAFSIGALGSVALITGLRRRAGLDTPRFVFAGLAAFTILTTAHGLMMVLRNTGDHLPVPTAAFLLGHFGAFFGEIFAWGLRSMWMPGGYAIPNPDAFPVDNAYGWTFILVAFLAVARSIWTASDARTIGQAALLWFVVSALCLYTLMIILRLGTTEPQYFGLFVIGQRYIVFGALFGLLAMIWACRSLLWPGKTALIALPIAAAGSLWANSVFIHEQMPKIWPHLAVDATASWQAVLMDATNAIESGSPVPNGPVVTGQCPTHVRDFAALLKHGLRIPLRTPLAWGE